MSGPHWIKQWIADLALLNDQFRNEDGNIDFVALGREEYQFRMALITRRFSKSGRAKEIYEKAKIAYDTNVERGKKGGRPRKDTTADGDIREDSQAERDGSAITRNETRMPDALDTSANIYGDAIHREAGDVSATVSDFSGARESTRTDGHSLRVGNVARPPVRSGRNSRCPNSREEFHAFVADNNLHEGLAEEWYAIHEARGWVDENGNPIKNWRGALKNFCIKVEQKRRTA